MVEKDGKKWESKREIQEREEQSAAVKQTDLSLLSSHKESVLTATRAMFW